MGPIRVSKEDPCPGNMTEAHLKPTVSSYITRKRGGIPAQCSHPGPVLSEVHPKPSFSSVSA